MDYWLWKSEIIMNADINYVMKWVDDDVDIFGSIVCIRIWSCLFKQTFEYISIE